MRNDFVLDAIEWVGDTKMEKKILIAMDESKNAMKAVEYVATTVGKVKGINITLFSVIPDFPPVFLETGETIHPVFKGKVTDLTALTVQKQEAMKKVMEKAKNILTEAGIPKKNVSMKAERRKIGIARDILKEAEIGGYDTIVVGRRGLSAAKRFLFGSISHKIVHSAKNRTIWVVE